jgi:phospholipid/cholesterol/gamma-HCH transport system ATP-binding protein
MFSSAAIELRNVSLSFGEKVVISQVSFRLESGNTLFLLGPNGSGKSVLLKLIIGLLKPDSGEILIDGQDIVPLSEEQLSPLRRCMGMVFQETALFDSLSIYENVAYELREAGMRDEAEIEKRVREALRFLEMETTIDEMPANLSGGMRRRVAIARATVSQPTIVLYDSPTAGLDPVTAETIIVLIAKLRDARHVTSVVVTERLQDAFFLSNFVYSPDKKILVPAKTSGHPGKTGIARFLLLRDGAVYFQGTEKQLVSTQDPYLRRFLA